MIKTKLIIWLPIALLLSACGGGGDSDTGADQAETTQEIEEQLAEVDMVQVEMLEPVEIDPVVLEPLSPLVVPEIVDPPSLPPAPVTL